MRSSHGGRQFLMSRAALSIIVISVIGILFVLWVTFLYPRVEDTLDVWMLFMIFYVLIIAFWMTLFIGLFGAGFKSFKSAFVMSVISAIIDIFYPPFSIDINGNMIESSTSGYRGSIDYTIGYYLNQAGIHGIMVFLLTYAILPALILFLVLFALKPKEFINTIKNAV